MMELENEDVQAWMQEQGIAMPAPPTDQQGPTASQQDPAASQQDPAAGQQDPAAGQGGVGGPGALQDFSEEDRAKMREEFQNMTADERATRMDEMGIERPEGGAGARPGGGMGPSNALFGYLVEFLIERAAA
jgi:hypothetical protein